LFNRGTSGKSWNKATATARLLHLAGGPAFKQHH
jgi:hypothetical protein